MKGELASLRRLLLHSDPRVQQEAVLLLKRAGTEAAAEALEEATDTAVIESAVYEALSELAYARSVPALERGLAHRSDYVRALCARGLGRANARDRAAGLIPLLEDPDTRGEAIIALGRLRAANAAEKIRPFLKDRGLRIVSIRALGLLKDATIEPFLRARADDLDPSVREACLIALVRLGRKDLPETPRSAEGLAEMNGLTRPEAWRKVCESMLRQRRYAGTGEEIAAAWSRETGFEIRWEDPPDWRRSFNIPETSLAEALLLLGDVKIILESDTKILIVNR